MQRLSRIRDPRCYQVAVLTTLLTVGVVILDFGIRWQNALAIMLAAQAVQYIGTRAAGLPRFDPVSALILSKASSQISTEPCLRNKQRRKTSAPCFSNTHGIWRGAILAQYQASVRERQEREAQQLANMTGWDIGDIRRKISFAGGIRPEPEPEPEPWWKRIWN